MIASYIRQAIFIVASIGLVVVFSGLAEAAEKAEDEKKPEPKPQATCPIMGGKINKELYVDTNGKRIYVCCKGCLEMVKKDPAAALKKLAELGEEAEDVPIDQKVCPVMGGPINKDLFVEHEGKKLYVCCKACLETIKKEPAKYVKKIEEQIEQDKAKEKTEKDESTAKTEKKDTVWTCAMHPRVRKDKPGKCPICAMDLIPAKQEEKAESKEPEKKADSKEMENKQKDTEQQK